MKLNNRAALLLLIIFAGMTMMLQSCLYTFNPGTTGGAKTLLIRNFQDFSALGPPYTRQLLTERLKSYFQQNSSLSIVNQNSADWELSGQIVAFGYTPIAAQANQQAGGNRLTISVKVTFINNLDAKKNYEQVFTFYNDFGAGQSPTEVERRLTENIIDQLVFDIYTRTTSDW
jgi:hypothetical protein